MRERAGVKGDSKGLGLSNGRSRLSQGDGIQVGSRTGWDLSQTGDKRRWHVGGWIYESGVLKTGQGLRNQSLRPQGTNESHNTEIISKGFRDYLRTEYRWKREGCRQGPLLLRVGKMARNQQQNTKENGPWDRTGSLETCALGMELSHPPLSGSQDHTWSPGTYFNTHCKELFWCLTSFCNPGFNIDSGIEQAQ